MDIAIAQDRTETTKKKGGDGEAKLGTGGKIEIAVAALWYRANP